MQVSRAGVHVNLEGMFASIADILHQQSSSWTYLSKQEVTQQ